MITVATFDSTTKWLVVTHDGVEVANVDCVEFSRRWMEDPTDGPTYGMCLRQSVKDKAHHTITMMTTYASAGETPPAEVLAEVRAAFCKSK